MAHIFKATAFLVLMICGVSVAEAGNPKNLAELDQRVDALSKQCKDLFASLQNDTCIWSWFDAELVKCKGATDPKMKRLCVALDTEENRNLRDSYASTLKSEIKLSQYYEAEIRGFIAYEVAHKAPFNKLYDRVHAKLIHLETYCKTSAKEMAADLDPLFDLYGKMGGKSCRGQRR